MVYIADLIAELKKGFEVDSTESIWYNGARLLGQRVAVLKLTPQSQYGIPGAPALHGECWF